jgi:hypothetical protein
MKGVGRNLTTDFASELLKRCHELLRLSVPFADVVRSKNALFQSRGLTIPSGDSAQAPKARLDLNAALHSFLTMAGLLRRMSIDRTCLASLERARCNLAFTVPTGTPKIRAASLADNSCT